MTVLTVYDPQGHLSMHYQLGLDGGWLFAGHLHAQRAQRQGGGTQYPLILVHPDE